jgi:DNA-binding CsgD family transcriptional regulator
LSKSLHVDSSIFVLPDEKSKFTDFFTRNIEEKNIREFKNYYYQYDPFKLIPGPFSKKSIVKLDEVANYPAFLHTEYYYDFLRPQHIYYKIVAYLVSRGKSRGYIALFRPEGSENFSKEEINMISTLSPYMAHALDHIELYQKNKLMTTIVEIIEKKWDAGLFILDDSMKVVYVNPKAKELCKNMCPDALSKNVDSYIPPIVLEDCLVLHEESKKFSALPVIPKYRVIGSHGSQKFSLYSQVIEKEMSPENSRLFMVSMEEVSELASFKQDSLKKMHHLTRREIEIVSHIFNGLRNAEIAQRLSVSEITVKKHIQNIFEKVSVKNRTALIHKILTKDSCTT